MHKNSLWNMEFPNPQEQSKAENRKRKQNLRNIHESVLENQRLKDKAPCVSGFFN